MNATFRRYLIQFEKQYQKLADLYAEYYGIVLYRVEKNQMIYNVSYPAYLSEPRHTYQFTVNLDTYQSSQGKLLKRYDSKAVVNRH